MQDMYLRAPFLNSIHLFLFLLRSVGGRLHFAFRSRRRRPCCNTSDRLVVDWNGSISPGSFDASPTMKGFRERLGLRLRLSDKEKTAISDRRNHVVFRSRAIPYRLHIISTVYIYCRNELHVFLGIFETGNNVRLSMQLFLNYHNA